MNRSIRKINNLQGNIVPERRRFESLNVNKSQLRTSVTNSDHTSREMKVDLVEKTMDTRREVNQIELLSHYQEALSQRALRLKIQQMH